MPVWVPASRDNFVEQTVEVENEKKDETDDGEVAPRWLHLDRIAGGHRHHCDSGGAAAARAGGGQGKRQARRLRE